MGAARCKKGSGFPRKCVCLQRALNSNLNRSCCCCSCCGYLWSCMSTGQTDRQTERQAVEQPDRESVRYSFYGIPTHCQSSAQWDLLGAWVICSSFWGEHAGGVWSTEFNHQFCILLCKCSRYSFVWKVCPLALETKFPKLSEHICIDNFGDAMWKMPA